MTENEIGRIVIDAALTIHRELGPGLLETVYEAVLAHELRERGLVALRQVPVPVFWRGKEFYLGFRADIIIEGKVLLELKSIVCITDTHRKQLLTYLKLSGLRLGFLLNFGEALMRDGIVLAVYRLPEHC